MYKVCVFRENEAQNVLNALNLFGPTELDFSGVGKTDLSILIAMWLGELRDQMISERYDDRNKFSVTAGAALADMYSTITLGNDKTHLINISDIVSTISRSHRTLQQAFSGSIFKLIRDRTKDKKDIKAVAEAFGVTAKDAAKYYCCPCI